MNKFIEFIKSIRNNVFDIQKNAADIIGEIDSFLSQEKTLTEKDFSVIKKKSAF
jgi:hypothetical protein